MLLLFFSGPASAVKVGVDVPSSADVGEEVNFKVYVDISSNERISVKNLTLTIEGVTTCTFDVDGNEITGCDGLTIEPLDIYTQGYDQGELFGYGYGLGYNYTVNYKSELTYKYCMGYDRCECWKL